MSLTVLLALQVCFLFLAQPAAALGMGIGFWFNSAMVVAMIWTVAMAAPNRGVAAVALLVMLPTVVAVAMRRWWSTPLTDGLGAFAALVATLAMSGVVGYRVYRPGRISAHRLRGAFVLYFNIAIGFGAIYLLTEELSPGSFRGIEANETQQQLSADLLYFSVITLSSTGFGDIVPVHRIARGLASFEAVIGQLYIATVLGRFITLQGSQKESSNAEETPNIGSRSDPS